MALVSILRTPLPVATQTLYTATRSTEIADNIGLVNTYGIGIWVYLSFVPQASFPPTGAMVYGRMLTPNEVLTFDQRYMRVNDRIQGYANIGNAVQLTANIITP